MIPAGYGEDQPRLDDDRLPIILLVLDGLGDRAIPELGGRTPSEAANTPNLDRLAAAGMNGWHIPFGWGRAPSSEWAHWAMFGYADEPFPGRAVLEALGAGVAVAEGEGVLYAALRTSRVAGDRLLVTGRAERGPDDADANALLAELQAPLQRHGMALQSLGSRGQAILKIRGSGFAAVTDSDPFFETFHYWLKPLAIDSGATQLAADLNAALHAARARLLASPINARRRTQGKPALDVLTTKWAGGRLPTPPFSSLHGIRGAAVTDATFYRGLAEYLGMRFVHLKPESDPGVDVARRLDCARQLIAEGARFVHVHTKATDEAGHTKNPFAKRDVLEAIDAGLAALPAMAQSAVIAITGDHATPSVNGVLHTGDPTPLVVIGPTVRADPVRQFGECHAAEGWLKTVAAQDVMPLLAGFANRPMFMGHRLSARAGTVLPDAPVPMPLRGPDSPAG